MRVLVLGGSGMLGHKLVQTLAAERAIEVHSTVRQRPPHEFSTPGVSYHVGVDAGPDLTRLKNVLRDLAPDVIVNAVGAIKQYKLESNPEQAFWINGELPHLLPFFNSKPEARVIHFSTDCVFTGSRGNYTEADRTDALDVYGRSKAAGEIDYGPHLTLRTSIIGFEFRGCRGLLSWLFSQRRGSTLPGYRRAIFSGLPTSVLSLLVRRIILEFPALSGLWHVASQPITKLELLDRINTIFDLGHTIVPDDSVAIDRSLSDVSFRAATKTTTPTWDVLLPQLVDDYRSLPYNQIYKIPTNA
jgi:dTDP-4-dehydrorhamnose reductase